VAETGSKDALAVLRDCGFRPVHGKAFLTEALAKSTGL